MVDARDTCHAYFLCGSCILVCCSDLLVSLFATHMRAHAHPGNLDYVSKNVVYTLILPTNPHQHPSSVKNNNRSSVCSMFCFVRSHNVISHIYHVMGGCVKRILKTVLNFWWWVHIFIELYGSSNDCYIFIHALKISALDQAL